MTIAINPVRLATAAFIAGGASLLIGCSGEAGVYESMASQKGPQVTSDAQIAEANRLESLDNHNGHAHHQAAITPAYVVALPGKDKKPGPPSFADRFDGQYRILSERSHDVNAPGFVASPPTARGGSDCILDFVTPNLVLFVPGGGTTGALTHWADRAYIPWVRDCGSGSRLDLRASIYNHMHVGFEGSDFTFCPTDLNHTPAYIDDDGSCTLLDINTLKRTYASTHGWNEILVLRAYFQYSSDSAPFDLKRIRIVREDGARVCYKKANTPASDGPWIGSEQGTSNNPSTAQGWYCWNHLDQGTWDLSAWATNVSRVQITGSTLTHATFAIDDIHVQIHQ